MHSIENLKGIEAELNTDMAIWVVEFSSGGTKLERYLHKNQHTQRKLLNFEFWINCELSKIVHHFSNKKILKMILSKKCQ